MSCLGYKGGIGTASRVLPGGATVGVLTLTNFGDRDRLTVAGVPAGRLLPDPRLRAARPGPAGSCIVVVITDGPLDSAACQRLARRAGPGPGPDRQHRAPRQRRDLPGPGHRAARPAAAPRPRAPVTGRALDDYFAAVTEATEEAVHQQPAAGGDRDRPGREHLPSDPADALRALVAEHGRRLA